MEDCGVGSASASASVCLRQRPDQFSERMKVVSRSNPRPKPPGALGRIVEFKRDKGETQSTAGPERSAAEQRWGHPSTTQQRNAHVGGRSQPYDLKTHLVTKDASGSSQGVTSFWVQRIARPYASELVDRRPRLASCSEFSFLHGQWHHQVGGHVRDLESRSH